MKVKTISGSVLTFLGVLGLIIGLFGIFGSSVTKQNPWIYTILGAIFFLAGINLLKSTD